MKYETLSEKKLALDALRPMPPALVRNLDEWFKVELTFTSNAIEGSTLTRRETALVIEKGLTVAGKSLREHIEASNHAKALDLVQRLASGKTTAIVAKDILAIHEIILRGVDDENSGRYRTVPVRISGSAVIVPNPRKVPELMDAFHDWLAGENGLHPVALAGEAHYRLVTIHPFIDGNGRTARLLMNLILMMHGYPPAIIRKRERLAYISALEKAQLGGSKHDFETLIAKAADRSLDILLSAAKGETADYAKLGGDVDHLPLMKIGELAKATGETVPTIRFWTKEGLLQAAETTASGYHLYAPDMAARCAEIKRLKAERLTIREIRERLN